MKKRFLSFLMVFCFVFTGFFAVCGFAFSPWEIILERGLEDIINGDNLDFWLGLYPTSVNSESLQNELANSRLGKIANHAPPQDEISLINWDSEDDVLIQHPTAHYFFMTDSMLNTYSSTLAAIVGYIEEYNNVEISNYKFFIYSVSMMNGSYNQINGKIFWNCDDVSYSFDFDPYDLDKYNQMHYYLKFDSTVSYASFQFTQSANGMSFGGHYYPYALNKANGCYVDSGSEFRSSFIPNAYATNLQPTDDSVHWLSSFVQSDNDLTIKITATSNTGVPDVTGYTCAAGVVYKDSANLVTGFPSSDYMFFNGANGGSVVGANVENIFTMNIKDLKTFAYRHHAPHDTSDDFPNFYAFAVVYDPNGDEVHYNEYQIKFNKVDDGIFADVQQLPDYDDYKPTPSPFPTFPTPTFNYSPNNNYTTYNYDTVNNYDSTTQNFNDWLGDTITTINNNLSGGLDNLSHNISITGDNIKNFTEEVKNYVEGSGADISEYIGDLIKKFNNDFNAWTDSFGSYLGDLFQTLNVNLNVIADNIINAIKIQAIPEKENVIDICKSNFPLYNDFATLFSEHDVSDSDLIVAIPYLSNDNANGIELVTRELNTASADEPEEISRELNSDYDPIMTPYLEGYYVFNISNLLRDDTYNFARFRTVATIIILGATFFALFNITLKCFGMHFGSLSASDSKDDS